MTTKLTLDNSGRIVMPKALRKEMNLGPGDTLLLESKGAEITLRPFGQETLLKKEQGAWVYQGESADLSIPEFIDGQRQEPLQQLAAVSE
jgi:AbrB family looped-hinge helix DNA binding protein